MRGKSINSRIESPADFLGVVLGRRPKKRLAIRVYEDCSRPL